MIPFLGPFDPFPAVESARDDMGGLLAVGGDLGPARLLDAYRHGIFPWGTVETQPLWYSPDPRMVLFPDEFRLSRSLQKTLRAQHFEVRGRPLGELHRHDRGGHAADSISARNE